MKKTGNAANTLLLMQNLASFHKIPTRSVPLILIYNISSQAVSNAQLVQVESDFNN